MKIKPATEFDRLFIRDSIRDLRVARINLRAAGAVKAVRAVARALKSAEGALRHVERRIAAGAEYKIDPEVRRKHAEDEVEAEVSTNEEVGACSNCGSLSPWRCGCNDE